MMNIEETLLRPCPRPPKATSTYSQSTTKSKVAWSVPRSTNHGCQPCWVRVYRNGVNNIAQKFREQ